MKPIDLKKLSIEKVDDRTLTREIKARVAAHHKFKFSFADEYYEVDKKIFDIPVEGYFLEHNLNTSDQYKSEDIHFVITDINMSEFYLVKRKTPSKVYDPSRLDWLHRVDDLFSVQLELFKKITQTNIN